MKASRIVIVLLMTSMLVGCKKCEDPIDKWTIRYALKCDIDGQHCEEKWNDPFLISVPQPEFCNFTLTDKLFNFHFKTDISNEKVQVCRLEANVVLSERPVIGKKYPLMNLCDWDEQEPLSTGCWARLLYIPYFYECTDTLQLPEEVRKKRAIIRTDKSSGYIIFDKITLDTNSSGEVFGDLRGRFEFTVQGQNKCYSNIQPTISVTNGFFFYKVQNDRNVNSHSPFSDIFPECVSEN